jgi:hypothetical protein
MTPEAPLTKLEAQRRCLAEVPNAYPGAFKKAWWNWKPLIREGVASTVRKDIGGSGNLRMKPPASKSM